ncbi:MAG: autotransporter outer membrane beta-barrel domain-containing protein [Puniceicoccales bacterium]|jgi:outer membrane autotransporter protein|nr:autotransporter outer membrane beta-barrel domain-containing protein [Puniceicoccales bacterium]
MSRNLRLSKKTIRHAVGLFSSAFMLSVVVPVNAAVSIHDNKNINDLQSSTPWDGTLSTIDFRGTPGGNRAILTFPGAGSPYLFEAASGGANQRTVIGASGDSYAGAFHLESGSKLEIRGNTLTTGSGSAFFIGEGSEFKVTGVAESGSEFAVNGNTAGSGGAFFVKNNGSSTLFLGVNAIFSNNRAVDGSGGVLEVADIFTLRNAGTLVFQGNSASTNGGAIHARNNLTLGSGIRFENNSAVAYGGAIGVEGQLSLGDGNVFTGNTAQGNGGAVYAENHAIFGNDTSFVGNTVTGQGDGGAINAKSVVLGDNAVFERNAAKSGGAIYLSHTAAPGDAIPARLDLGGGAIFRENIARNVGGGAIYTKDSFELNAAGLVTFEANEAQLSADGGAIYVRGRLVTKAAAAFLGNKSTNGSGGAVYVRDSASFVGGSIFAGNSAGSSGGAISSGGNVTLGANTHFGGPVPAEGNSAIGNGGAIFLSGMSLAAAEVVSLDAAPDVVFENNSAFGAGGAVAVASSRSLLINASGPLAFRLNVARTADTGGGAIFAGRDLVLPAAATFAENKAESGSGGAVYAGGDVTLGRGVVFDQNSAGAGGAIFIGGMSLSGAQDAVFAKNSATADGGAIFATGALEMSGASGAKFTENRAISGHGGAISSGGALTLGASVVFEDNAAGGDGGAISVAGDATLGAGARLAGNTAGDSGGAISLGGSKLTLGDGVSFAKNSAASGNGGAIAAGGDKLAIAHEGALSFVANKSPDGLGGAIHVAGALSIRGNTLFKNNESAAMGGGAIAAASLVLDADSGDIYFTGNKEAGASGAVALSGGTSVFKGQEKRAIVFDDPLHHAPGALPNVLVLGVPNAQFAGDNVLNPPGESHGGIQVESGVLRVLGGAVLDAGGSPFNAARGSTIAGAGTIASAASAPIRIAGIVSPDSLRYIPNADLSKEGTWAGFDTGTLTLDGDADLSGAEIRLQVNPAPATSDKLVVTGHLTLDEGSRINISGSISFDGGSYDGPSGTPLIETGGGITGIPGAEVSIPEAFSADDFLVSEVGLDSTGRNLVLRTVLAWYSTNTQTAPVDLRAHGHFTLGQGRTFSVNVPLDDHSNNLGDAWVAENPAGRILTKLGPGTLVLAAAGNYSGGTRLEQGTLRLAAAGAAGTGPISAAAGSLLELDFTGALGNTVSSGGGVAVLVTAAVEVPEPAGGAVSVTAANFANAGTVLGEGVYALGTLVNAAGASLAARAISATESITNHGDLDARVITGTLVNGVEGTAYPPGETPFVRARETITGGIINRGRVEAGQVNTPSGFDVLTPLIQNHGDFTAGVVTGTINNTGTFQARTVNAPVSPLPGDARLITNTGTFAATTVNGSVLNGTASAVFSADAVSGLVENHGVFSAGIVNGNVRNFGQFNAAPALLASTTVTGLVDNSGGFNAGIINAPEAGLPEGRSFLVDNSGALSANTINGALRNSGTASLGAVNGAVRNSGTIHLRASAAWGALDNSGGTVVFEHAGHQLTVDSLSAGTGAERGVYRMDVSHFDPLASDLLKVGGNISGEHHFILKNLSNPEADLDKTPVVSAPNNVDLRDERVTGEMVTPLWEYNFMEDDNGGYMLAKASVYGPGATVAANTVGAMSIEWFTQLNNIDKRLGDLRLNAERIFPIRDYHAGVEDDDFSAAAVPSSPRRLHGQRPTHPYGIWARAHGQQVDAHLGITGLRDFREHQYGMDVGADREFAPNTRNLLHAGAFAGYLGAMRDFRDKYGSRGSTDSVAIGLYGAWLHDSGLFAEGTLKGQLYANEYDALDDKADFTNGAIGLSFRLGYRWNLAHTFFVQPDLSFAWVHIFGADYDTRNNLRVRVGGSDVRDFQAGIRGGKVFDLGSLGLFQPYLRAGIEAQTSDSGGVRIGILNLHPNTDGTRGILGLGFAWQVDVRQQVYFDYEFAKGDKYTRPWAVSLGYRRLF